MKSRASWAALLLLAGGGEGLAAAQRTVRDDAPPPPASLGGTVPEGYQPSTGERPGEKRYDEVGYASWYGGETNGGPTASGEPFDPARMTAAHATLPLPSFAEVTALDSGRTVLVRINDRWQGGRGRIIDLSRAAAQALGLDGRSVAGVRVRAVNPLPADVAALAAGRAVARADAPNSVLVALRRRLPAAPQGSVPPPAPSRVAAVAKAPMKPGGRGYLVQVAALSSAERARAVAGRLGGQVVPGGRLYRVQLGPFADAAGAERARGQAARAGFGDARVIPSN
jgi:rare lipoprotein A